tara:strand:- start:47 stop:343 length:297 start_codon:yes stop_codon:yes gene_type:complete
MKRVLSRTWPLARAKRHELIASKLRHANRVLVLLVGVGLGRVTGGRALMHFSCPANLHQPAPRHVQEATAQLVAVETAVDVEHAAARAVEDVEIVRRP